MAQIYRELSMKTQSNKHSTGLMTAAHIKLQLSYTFNVSSEVAVARVRASQALIPGRHPHILIYIYTQNRHKKKMTVSFTKWWTHIQGQDKRGFERRKL